MCCQTAFSVVCRRYTSKCAGTQYQCPLAEASDNAGTSVMQPHSQGQLGLPPNILAVLSNSTIIRDFCRDCLGRAVNISMAPDTRQNGRIHRAFVRLVNIATHAVKYANLQGLSCRPASTLEHTVRQPHLLGL